MEDAPSPSQLSLHPKEQVQIQTKRSVKLRDDWTKRSRPIPPGGTYPAKDHCSKCGLCDTYFIAHLKNACPFLGDDMARIEAS